MKQKHRILIVEDEALYSDLLTDLILELGHEHLGTFDNASEALSFIAHTPPDMLLLDIHLRGEMDGIELAAALQDTSPVPVIFITSQVDDATYARARATGPCAFLEKSSRKRQLQRAIDLASPALARPLAPPAKHSEQDSLLVKVGSNLHRVRFEDIVYVQAEDHHCNIFTSEKKHVSRISLRELTQVLPKDNFFQVHRSYLLRLSAIQSISTSQGTIQTIEGFEVPLGRSFRDRLLEKMKMI